MSNLYAGVTCLGDLRCPHCKNIIVTPSLGNGGPCKIRSGDATCIACNRVFMVTESVARLANKRLSLPLDDLQEVLEELVNDEGGLEDG